MSNFKKFWMVFIALVIMIGGTGIMVRPAQAASCSRWHTVRAGESLSWIGRWYGVSWPYLASINQISPPYVIYTGQKICVSTTSAVPAPSGVGWSYAVVGVKKDVSVTIRTHNFPDNVHYEVYIGRKNSGVLEWQKVADLDSDKGGTFNKAYNIPAAFAGTSSLVTRLTQVKKGVSVDRWFSNIPAGSGTGGGGLPPYYSSVPTIWVSSVVRNSKVTIRTSSFPPGIKFDVLMGPMGTRAIGGYYVASFNSGAGGIMVKTFDIPAQLLGRKKIAIRTQNLATGFYSYNWFFNNTTY